MDRSVRGPVRSRPGRASLGSKHRQTGTCGICGLEARNALVVKGRWFVDGNGESRQAEDAAYHRECFSMLRRGLLSAGYDRPKQDSVGKPCGGCNSVLEDGDEYAHRSGVPYHKECLI